METFVSLGEDVSLVRLRNEEYSLYLIGRLVDGHCERYSLSDTRNKSSWSELS